MKKIALIAALGLIGMGSAMAQTATGNFNVQINLTSKCEINNTNSGAASLPTLTLDYTSFQLSPASGTTNFDVRCTSGLPYRISLDAAGLEGVGFGTQTAGTNTGLVYSLAIDGASRIADGNNRQHTITGTIAAGLAGTCTGATCNDTIAKTVFINY